MNNVKEVKEGIEKVPNTRADHSVIVRSINKCM